jgi:hypothetical protein
MIKILKILHLDIYHGVPGIGLVEIGFALPFVLSSSKFRSDINDDSPYEKKMNLKIKFFF